MKKIFLLTKVFILIGYFVVAQDEFFIKTYNFYQLNLDENIDKKNHPLNQIIYDYNVVSIEKPFKTKDVNIQHTYVLKTSSSIDIKMLAERLKKYTFIEYIEEVPDYELFYTPNDPLYTQQYALPLVNAPTAWDIATCVGNSQVVLAVTDDAVRITHEDIAPILWNNPYEIPNNGIDDDNNGYIDDVVGWDAADNDNNPSPPISASSSYFSHGTHVAGIAAGATDNNLGIASIGFGVQLMPVKIGANSSGSLTGAWAGIDYTIACGYVDVVNMSWGGGSYSQTYQNLITAGYNQGITFVAAAGNSNTSAPMFPAAYNHVISVAATNQTDTRASFSNYGNAIDVAAPGVSILSTVAGAGGVNDEYGYKQGTSMASPLVAGLCALMKCYNYSATPYMIESCLKTTAVNIDAQNPSYINQLGAGRIDAQAALQCLSTSPVVDFHTEDTLVCPSQSVQFYSQSSGVQPLTYNWTFTGGTPATSTLQNPVVTYASVGVYNVTLTVTNAYGNDILTKTGYINVATPTATISGNTTIISGGVAFLRVDFTGIPPFDITYTDGASNFAVNGIQYSPYYIQVNPIDTTTYTLISMSNDNCNGSVSGGAQVNISTNSSSNLDCNYLKTYNNTDFVNDLIYYNNKLYMSGRATSGNLFVSNMELDGTINWSREYRENSGATDFLGTILMADNNSDILTVELKNNQVILYRIDNAGNVVWNKRLTNGILRRSNIVSAGNNQYYLVCWYAPSGSSDNLVVYKFDGSGNVLWSFQYNNADDQYYKVISNGSGGLTMLGRFSSSAFILEIDQNGNIIQSKKNNISNFTEYNSIYKDGNNYYLHGYETSGVNAKIFIEKLDVNFNVVWHKSTNWLSNIKVYDGDILKDASGNFYLFTPIFIGSSIQDDLIIKFDEFGNILKQKTTNFNTFLLFHGVIINGVSGEEMYITYTSPYFTNGDKVGLIRTDTTLNSCAFTDTLLAFTSTTTSTSNITFAKSNITLNVFNNSPTVSNFNTIVSSDCVVGCNNNQNNCNNLFQKIINDNGTTERGNIFPTSDGGYIISASTTAYGVGSYDIILYRYDLQDNLLWSKTYGTNSSELSSSIPITEMNNGDIVFACESNQRLHCFRVNNNGNIVWQKRLNISSGDCQGKNLIKDGNDILIVGSIRGFGVGGYDAYVYKIDGNGNTIWSNMYGTSSNDHIDDIVKSSSGDYYVVGATDSQSPSVNFLSKINSTGVVQWTKKHTKSGSTEQLKSIIEAPNGNLIAYGNTGIPSSYDLKLIRFDINGNIISSKIMAGNNEDRVNEIFGLSDGSVIISGYTNSLGNGNYDLFVSKYDNAFNEIWTKVYGGSNSDRTIPLDNNLYINENEGFGIIVGNTQSFGGSNKDLYIVKFSLTDDTLCNEIKGQLWNNSNLNLLTAIQNFTINTMPIFVNSNFSELTAPTIEFVICEVLCDSTIQPIICQNHKTDTLLCSGDSIQINITNASNISWSPNYNISDIQSASPILWPEVDTSYIVYYEDSICQYFDTIHVIVSSLDVEASFSDTLVCPNINTQLNASGAISYVWSPSNNLNNSTIANPIFNGNTNDTLIVIGQNTYGCEDSDTVNINVLPCCGAFADLEINDSVICVNESVTFLNTSITGNNPMFTWNFGTGATPATYVGQNPPAVTYSLPGIHQVQLVLSDDCGQDTITKNVYVNDLPLLNLSPDTSICGNDTIHYQLGDAGIADYTYTWIPPTGLDNPSIANPIASINYSETYTVVIIDNFTSCVNTDSVSIQFTNQPDTIIKYSASYICTNDSVLLYIDVPNDSLLWSNGSNSDTLNFVILQDTQVTVRLYVDSCIFYDTLNIVADTIPSVSLLFNDTVCINSWDTITIQTTGIPVWESGDTTSVYPIFVAQDTTLYLTTYNGLCETVDTIQIYIRALPEDSILGIDTVCINSTETFVVSGIYSYLWSNGSVYDSSNYFIQSDTTIYVTYEDAFCQNTDSLHLFVVDTPQVILLGDTNYCHGDVVNLMVNTTDSVYWNNGTVGNTYNGNADVLDNTIIVNQYNIYCGVVTDSINLNIDTIPVRIFNYADTVCQFERDTIIITSEGITTTLNNDTVTHIDFIVNNDTSIIVQTFNGDCSIFDTIQIYVRLLPNLSILGNDTTCINTLESYSLTAGYTYLWSNGSSTINTQYSIESDTLVYVLYEDEFCSNLDSLFVVAIDTPTIQIIGDTQYCEGDLFNLSLTTNDSIWWGTGSNQNPLIDTAISSQIITAAVYNDYCGNYTSSISIIVDTFPEIDVISPIDMYENDEQQAVVNGNATEWNWTPPYGLSCINCKEPIINADSSIVYILSASNNGCISYDTLIVNIKKLQDCIVIPTAFSPNGDAVNNTFKPIVLDDKTILESFRIYNRWGEKIHDSLSPWDGTYKGVAQSIDVYIYVVNYNCKGENKVMSGNVTLIR